MLLDQILAGVGVRSPVGGLVAPGALVGDEIGRLNGRSYFDTRRSGTGNWSWLCQSVGWVDCVGLTGRESSLMDCGDFTEG